MSIASICEVAVEVIDELPRDTVLVELMSPTSTRLEPVVTGTPGIDGRPARLSSAISVTVPVASPPEDDASAVLENTVGEPGAASGSWSNVAWAG